MANKEFEVTTLRYFLIILLLKTETRARISKNRSNLNIFMFCKLVSTPHALLFILLQCYLFIYVLLASLSFYYTGTVYPLQMYTKEMGSTRKGHMEINVTSQIGQIC